MYAVIETGGKQYRVVKDDVIDIERTAVQGKKALKVNFDRVLLIGDEKGVKVGTPVVKDAKVTADVMAEVRGPKVTIFKQKRRKGYRRKNGHRQDLLRVKIREIVG
ncbi:MAG TPA: 50S ribosomal protein L21 [Thermoanaerobaculia bacterium]|nr:50S ribosomal protein L21 [Thermoanaerobaculia bacterium]